MLPFLNPWLLLGTAAVGIPIVIHLLNRRKFDRVVWAAMRFVQLSLQKNKRRMQIEDLILLVVRCLIVLLLAVALARPLLRAAALLGRGPVTVVLLLDNSESMGYTDGIQTRFDLAKQAADQTIADLPQGSSAALFLASDIVEDIIPQPTADLNQVRQRIRQAHLTDRATNLLPALQRAIQTLTDKQSNSKQITLITDAQSSAFGPAAQPPIGTASVSESAGAPNLSGPSALTALLQLLQDNKADITTQFLFIGDSDSRNLAITSLDLRTELPTTTKSLRFEAQITNSGPTEVHDIPIKLFIDGSTLPSDSATIDLLPAHSAKSISLRAKLRTDGYHAITAQIPPDHLPADDTRSTIIRVLRQVHVLLVDGDPGQETRNTETFFLQAALQPVDPALRDQYFIQTQSVPITDLESTRLDGYDVVFLANVASLSPPTVQSLQRFLSDGRGLVIFPGPNTNLLFYNETLFRQTHLLPAQLSEPHGDAAQQDQFETLQSSNFENPITAFWNNPGTGNPAAAHFFRRFTLQLPSAKKSPTIADTTTPPISPPTIILRYANNSPAVIEHFAGPGRVVLFSSTANTRWNDLPVRASIFVPLINRLLDSLLLRQDDHFNITVGQKFTMRCPTDLLGKEAAITRQGSQGPLPASPRVELNGPYPTLTFDDTTQAGVYKIAITGDTNPPTPFAIQTNPTESDLTPLSPNQIKSLSEVATVTTWKPGDSTSTANSPHTPLGTELWPYFAITALILAVTETLLAHRFSQSK